MLKKIFVFGLLSLFSLFVQSSLVKLSFPEWCVPDGIAILCVYLGLYFRNFFGLVCAFALGLLADSASAIYLGPHAAGAVFAFYLTGVLSSRVYAERALAIMFVVGICALAKTLTYLSLVSFYAPFNLLGEVLASKMYIEVLLSAILAPVVFKILSCFSLAPANESKYAVSNSDKKVNRSFSYRSL